MTQAKLIPKPTAALSLVPDCLKVESQLTKLDRDSFPDKPVSPGSALPATYENFVHLVTSYGITAKFNTVKKRVDVSIPGFDPAAQNRDEVILSRLESLLVRNGMSVAPIRRYLLSLADLHSYDPLADWISSRPWDGRNRVPAICETLRPAADYPPEVRDFLVEKWLLSIVVASLRESSFRARGVLTLHAVRSPRQRHADGSGRGKRSANRGAGLMGFETQSIDLLCPFCGAQHRVRWHRIPVREPYRLVCRACGGVMREGRGVQDYEEPRLIAPKT